MESKSWRDIVQIQKLLLNWNVTNGGCTLLTGVSQFRQNYQPGWSGDTALIKILWCAKCSHAEQMARSFQETNRLILFILVSYLNSCALYVPHHHYQAL